MMKSSLLIVMMLLLVPFVAGDDQYYYCYDNCINPSQPSVYILDSDNNDDLLSDWLTVCQGSSCTQVSTQFVSSSCTGSCLDLADTDGDGSYTPNDFVPLAGSVGSPYDPALDFNGDGLSAGPEEMWILQSLTDAGYATTQSNFDTANQDADTVQQIIDYIAQIEEGGSYTPPGGSGGDGSDGGSGGDEEELTSITYETPDGEQFTWTLDAETVTLMEDLYGFAMDWDTLESTNPEVIAQLQAQGITEEQYNAWHSGNVELVGHSTFSPPDGDADFSIPSSLVVSFEVGNVLAQYLETPWDEIPYDKQQLLQDNGINAYVFAQIQQGDIVFSQEAPEGDEESQEGDAEAAAEEPVFTSEFFEQVEGTNEYTGAGVWTGYTFFLDEGQDAQYLHSQLTSGSFDSEFAFYQAAQGWDFDAAVDMAVFQQSFDPETYQYSFQGTELFFDHDADVGYVFNDESYVTQIYFESDGQTVMFQNVGGQNLGYVEVGGQTVSLSSLSLEQFQSLTGNGDATQGDLDAFKAQANALYNEKNDGIEAAQEAQLEREYERLARLREDYGFFDGLFMFMDGVAESAAGWSGYSSLFFDEGELLEWQEERDAFFADNLLGSQYWASALCTQKLDVPNKQVAFYENPTTGATRITGTVGGQILAHFLDGGADLYLYKFEIFAVNPRNSYSGTIQEQRLADDGELEPLCVSIYLQPGNVQLYDQPFCLEPGQTLSRAGNSAIVQYSENNYNQICLAFDDPPRFISGSNPLCDVIIDMPTDPSQLPDPTVVGGGSGDGGPQGGGPGLQQI